MSRNTPKTFAEARAITDPIRRADALLKLSQEAEDRRRAQTTMRKVEGQVLSDEQTAALSAFLAEWEADADNFGDEQELMDAIRDAIDGGVLPDNFDRVFNAAYQATVEEYNNPSPSLGYDAEAFARALTELINAIEGSSYEPNTRDSEKAARPAMRKSDSYAEIASGTNLPQEFMKQIEGEYVFMMQTPPFDEKYYVNDVANAALIVAYDAWDFPPKAKQIADEYRSAAKAARARMRKAAGRLAENSRVIRTAEGVFAKLMADDYFSKTYSESDLADAAVEIAAKMTGSGPRAKKIVRETGNMFI